MSAKVRRVIDALAEVIPEASHDELREIAGLLVRRCGQVSKFRDLGKGFVGWEGNKMKPNARGAANKGDENLIFAADTLRKMWAKDYKRFLSDRDALEKIVDLVHGKGSYRGSKSTIVERVLRKWQRLTKEGRLPRPASANPLRALLSDRDATTVMLKNFHRKQPGLKLFP